MFFSRVGTPPIRAEMTRVVELNSGDNARVWSHDQEIDRELTNPVPHGLIALPALELQRPCQLDLGQH
jgi:hypothetical protein